MNPVQDPSYRIRSSPDFLLCLPPHYRKYFGREVLVTDKFMYSFFKRVSIVTAPPPHPSIVTATPSSTPLENASSLVCHCQNWELQKAGLLPIPCVSLITGTGDKRCAAPEYNASVSWFKHPFQGLTLHHLWGGGGGKWERLDSLSPPPTKKKRRGRFLSGAASLTPKSLVISHTHTEAYTHLLWAEVCHFCPKTCVDLWWMVFHFHPPPPPPFVLFF